MIYPEYFLALTFDEIPPLQADVMQTWARAKSRKHWAELVYWQIRTQGKQLEEPLSCAHIQCTRYSKTMPDVGNIAYSFKGIIDALQPRKTHRKDGTPLKKISSVARAGIIAEDSPRTLESETYIWQYSLIPSCAVIVWGGIPQRKPSNAEGIKSITLRTQEY